MITRAAFLCTISLCAARADLTIVQNVEGGGPLSSMTMKIKGDKARIEAGPQMTTIIDSKTGDLLTLLNEQKKFITHVCGPGQGGCRKWPWSPTKKARRLREPQLKPTGKKETINGYETEEYTCEAPAFKGSYWISSKYPERPRHPAAIGGYHTRSMECRRQRNAGLSRLPRHSSPHSHQF